MKQLNEIELLKKQIEREITAQKHAESILRIKTEELRLANEELRALNDGLEQDVSERLQKLEASELRYRQIVESATDIIYRTNEQGYITYTNPVAESRFGFSFDELICKHYLDFVHPDYKDKVENFYASTRAGGLKETYLELPVIDNKGQVVWLGQSVRYIFQDGLVVETVAMCRDITEMRKTEFDLLSTKLRLSSLIANLQSGILVEDENRNIVLANQRFCNDFQIPLSPNQLTGIHGSQSEERIETIFKNPADFQNGIDKLLNDEEIKIGDELITNNGRILHRDYIPIHAHKEYLGHLWQYRDVTEEKLARQQLMLSEEKYRGIIENMELGLLEINNNGIIERAYKSFCRMVGYKESELIGKKAVDLLLPKEFMPVILGVRKGREEGNYGVYEIQIIKKDGSRIWVLVSSAPVIDNAGKVTGTAGLHFDITAHKNLQKELEEAKNEAEAAQEAEKQFLANMSHEIRTPLNAIIGMTHLLYDIEPTPEQKNWLDILSAASNNLLALISDLLDIAKIKAGKLEIHPGKFDLAHLLRNLKVTFQKRLENSRVKIRMDIAPMLNTLLIGDDHLLRQILLHLLGNAEKFTQEGEIGIRVSREKTKGRKITLRFEVYDTGIGIPENMLEMIFDNFRQVDGKINKKFGGSGLGLAIVKNLVELQGGNIRVASKVGHGTCLTVTLSYKDTGIKAPAEIETFDDNPDSLSNAGSVLVVDDNEMNRRYLSTLLEKWNIPHKMAVNGKECLEMTLLEPFDLIFLDIHMPELDGFETAVEIRKPSNPNMETPIVALTASTQADKKDMALKAGMNDFLSKPFVPDQMYRVLKKHLIQQADRRPAESVALPHQKSFSFSDKLDVDYLNEIYGDDSAYALTIFEAFLEKMQSEYPQLTPLFHAKQWTEISKLAHKIKPAFPMVGLTSLEQEFQHLEDKALAEKIDEKELASILTRIESLVSELLPIIVVEFERLKRLE